MIKPLLYIYPITEELYKLNGSYLDPHVEVLREFRDKYLLNSFKLEIPNHLGRAFVKLYYKYSPPVANYIRQHERLRTATRWALTPVVYGVRHPSITLIILCLAIVVIVVRRVRLWT